MDKARFAGRSAMEYFGYSRSKEISIDDAANQLVKELIGIDSDPCERESASSAEVLAVSSNTAMAALLIIHGEEKNFSPNQEDVAKKINDARKKYLQATGTVEKDKLATEFDEKLTNLLAQKLRPGVRLLYCEKAQKLTNAVQNGTATKFQRSQEMLHFLRDVSAKKVSSPHTEVMNAFHLIRIEQEDVFDGLFYLFNGKLDSNSSVAKKMEVYEELLKDIIANNENLASEELKLKYRREFTANARKELASRMPEPEKAEYLKYEKGQWDEFGSKNYEQYLESVNKWLIDRPVEKALDMALNRKSDDEVQNLLKLVIDEGGFYNYKQHNNFFYSKLSHSPHEVFPANTSQLHKDFISAAYRYIDSKSSISIPKGDKYEKFMTKAKERLLEQWKDVGGKYKEHLKIITELRENKYIDLIGFDESKDAYLRILLSPVEDKKSPSSSKPEDNPEDAELKKQKLKEVVANAFPESIAIERNKKYILEALTLCWGGMAKDRDSSYALGKLGQTKARYLEENKSVYASDPEMKFRPDNEFSIEARTQLVEKLDPELRQAYAERARILAEHCAKGNITKKTYWNGMTMFLEQDSV